MFCNASDVYVLPENVAAGKLAWTAFCNYTEQHNQRNFKNLDRFSPLINHGWPDLEIVARDNPPSPTSVETDITFASHNECDTPFNPAHCIADFANIYGVSSAMGHSPQDMHIVLSSGAGEQKPGAPFFMAYQALANKVSVRPLKHAGNASPVYEPMADGANSTGIVQTRQVVFSMNPYMSYTWGQKSGIKYGHPTGPLISRFNWTCETWDTNRCTEESSVLSGLRDRVHSHLDRHSSPITLSSFSDQTGTWRSHAVPENAALERSALPGLILFVLRTNPAPDGAGFVQLPCRRCVHNMGQVWARAKAEFPENPMLAINMLHVPFASQLRLLRAAQVVVAVHGGSLGNTLWLGPEQTLLELLPPDRGAPLAMFYHIAHQVGAKYKGLWLEESFSFQTGGQLKPVHLITMLREALEGTFKCGQSAPQPPNGRWLPETEVEAPSEQDAQLAPADAGAQEADVEVPSELDAQYAPEDVRVQEVDMEEPSDHSAQQAPWGAEVPDTDMEVRGKIDAQEAPGDAGT
ncbi:hypothetical protein CYMTET_47532 [Cymbomonas tetramitiformis]|uniref:Glycosyltransferase 61 catalytic domain-containing protein n=1 Tax=Cymbomonas tetramitiformis TaxID=36881 RepID=A0AAE0BVZ9_9CHLO|nr:hypothetical protein CYMTET_47532 [Cymbomonas tetramitiformis]